MQNVKTALQKNEIKIWLQPQIHCPSQRIIGAEALCRWHTGKEIILPGQFIPKIENTEIQIILDLYMYEKTCEFLRKRITQKKPVFPVAVNISRKTLTEPNTAQMLKNIAQKYEIPIQYTPIEITETHSAEYTQTLKTNLQTLKANHFLLEMDDFGTGFSSMFWLYEIHPDIIKIDMSMTKHLQNTTMQKILFHTARMASDLKIGTIIEGIETTEQMILAMKLGYKTQQGFLFTRPFPADTLENQQIRIPETEKAE